MSIRRQEAGGSEAGGIRVFLPKKKSETSYIKGLRHPVVIYSFSRIMSEETFVKSSSLLPWSLIY
ncbi:MAG: hypothetical protein F6K14_15455 [Symploca sp. SIO2C1]|nr:hypothetical protein [Symploca sp. SIO2C1]